MTVTRRHLNLLWQHAKKVGFTPEGLRVMLILLNVNPHTMTTETLRALWPYVNEINARKFSHGK